MYWGQGYNMAIAPTYACNVCACLVGAQGNGLLHITGQPSFSVCILQFMSCNANLLTLGILLLLVSTEAVESPHTKHASVTRDSTGTHTSSSHTTAQSKTPPQQSHHSRTTDSTTTKSSTPDSGYIEPLPDRPVQLVRPDPHHHLKLEIVDENVRHLHHIKTAVAVVAVVGKFHSGKSFLLNQLMGKTEGFGIGPYVRPQTMGIWMWGKVGVCMYVYMCMHSLL